MNWKSMLSILIIILLLPFLVELVIVNDVLGFLNSQFANEVWFGFWGSYIGSIVTVIVLWLTIRYNRRETENRLKEHEIDQKYNLLNQNIENLYAFITLKYYDDTHLVYKIRLELRFYFNILKKCIEILDNSEHPFFLACCKMLNAYTEITNEFNDVKLTNENIEIYAEKYKESAKKIIKTMHSKRNNLDTEYLNIKESIEEKRAEEKLKLYTKKKHL